MRSMVLYFCMSWVLNNMEVKNEDITIPTTYASLIRILYSVFPKCRRIISYPFMTRHELEQIENHN